MVLMLLAVPSLAPEGEVGGRDAVAGEVSLLGRTNGVDAWVREG